MTECLRREAVCVRLTTEFMRRQPMTHFVLRCWLSAGLLFALAASAAASQVTIQPRLGVEFESFGQTYRVTDEEDTVSTVDDWGTVLGVLLATPKAASFRAESDASYYYGASTERGRLRLRGEFRGKKDLFVVEDDATMRRFRDEGDYALSSDSAQQNIRGFWERRFTDQFAMRIQDEFELVRYDETDIYNLDSNLHRPGISFRRRFADAGEGRVAYRIGWRDLPDSAEINSTRHTVEFDGGTFWAENWSMDVALRSDRRRYADESPRRSSLEFSGEVDLDWMRPGLVSWKARPEFERIRYDEPSDVDVDSDRWGIVAGPVIRPAEAVEFHFGPLLEILSSPSTPAEEYREWGVRLALEWTRGNWLLSATDDVVRRDYATEAESTSIDLATLDVTGESDGIYSDSTIHRLALVGSFEFAPRTTLRLFVHWEPEEHDLARDNAETRLVAGGIEHRFSLGQ